MAAKGDSIGSRLIKGGSETFPQWCDRIQDAHTSVLNRILPNYTILESVPKWRRELQTFVYGSNLGLGVLSTNITGESFMYFVEQTRTPMGFQTCSSWQRRYSMSLAIREAYRLTILALKRGVFKRCYKAQYLKRLGQVRRIAE